MIRLGEDLHSLDRLRERERAEQDRWGEVDRLELGEDEESEDEDSEEGEEEREGRVKADRQRDRGVGKGWDTKRIST